MWLPYGAVVLEKLHGYAASFTKSVAGRSENLSTTALEGGARIHFVLQDIFVKVRALGYGTRPSRRQISFRVATPVD